MRSGRSVRSAVGVTVGGPNFAPRTGTEVTLPSAPETAWMVPDASTASAPSLPIVATGLADADRPASPVTPARASTRCAQILPLSRSSRAMVPPRRSTGTAVKVPGFGGSVARVAAGSPAVEVRGSIGNSWPAPVPTPTTAAPSCSTSSPLPAATLVATPVSSWPIGTLARANLAWASELTQTPESFRAASCTVEPWLATAT